MLGLLVLFVLLVLLMPVVLLVPLAIDVMIETVVPVLVRATGRNNGVAMVSGLMMVLTIWATMLTTTVNVVMDSKNSLHGGSGNHDM